MITTDSITLTSGTIISNPTNDADYTRKNATITVGQNNISISAGAAYPAYVSVGKELVSTGVCSSIWTYINKAYILLQYKQSMLIIGDTDISLDSGSSKGEGTITLQGIPFTIAMLKKLQVLASS